MRRFESPYVLICATSNLAASNARAAESRWLEAKGAIAPHRNAPLCRLADTYSFKDDGFSDLGSGRIALHELQSLRDLDRGWAAHVRPGRSFKFLRFCQACRSTAQHAAHADDVASKLRAEGCTR